MPAVVSAQATDVSTEPPASEGWSWGFGQQNLSNKQLAANTSADGEEAPQTPRPEDEKPKDEEGGCSVQ